MDVVTIPLESGALALPRWLQVRRSALQICRDPEWTHASLGELSAKEWQALLRWLDISGLALYFFDRVCERRLDHTLPSMIFERLERSLAENKQRTASMVSDLAEIASRFRAEALSFAVLKGITLWPYSFPRPWLRSQADLDFLIAARDVEQGRRVLEGLGFHLHAISGRSWEFRTGKIHTVTLESMYRAIPFRSVELHVETEIGPRGSLLARAECFRYEQLDVPVLPPADLLLGQGLHLYKHVCDEFFRASHVLEFHRHMLVRHADAAFWDELRAIAGCGSAAPLKLGVVTLLSTRLLGPAAPESFLEWTVCRLPLAARLWVSRYGERAAFTDPPGSKIFLLLQAALQAEAVPARRPALRVLLPSGLPRISSAPAGETLLDRLRRYRLHLRFLHMRLRFHVVEGLRYLVQLPMWSRALAQSKKLESSFIANRSACDTNSESLPKGRRDSDNPLTTA